jgi:hypothetical protein
MKRVVLLSIGLFFVAGYAGCLPSDSGSTTGTGGSGNPGSAGTGNPGTAGTGNPGAAGDTGNPGAAGTGNPGAAGTGNPGDAGSTGNPGAAGNGVAGAAGTGVAGNGAAGAAGNGAAGNGAAGNGNPGSGGRGGNGGSAQGGRGGMAGTSAGGTGGTAAGGRGGMAGTSAAGNGGSAAGTTGTGGTGNVAATLDGAMLLGPCMATTQTSVCATVASNAVCPDMNDTDIPLRGVKTTDKTITLGGNAGTTYTISLHVQGEVESKNYSGGTDQSTAGMSPKLDGWRVGGTPGTNNAYNVYMIRVTNPGATTHTDYFLNSIDLPGVENHTTYGIDYTTPTSGTLALTAQGGASLRLVAADSNCSMIKNCGPAENSGNVCSAPIVMTGIEPTAASKNATFNFNTAYNGQWIVLTVKSVTP